MDIKGINQRPVDLFALSEKMLQEDRSKDFPYEVEALGRKFLVFRDVWAPRSAEAMAGLLSFSPGIDFLEVGTGTGIVPGVMNTRVQGRRLTGSSLSAIQ